MKYTIIKLTFSLIILFMIVLQSHTIISANSLDIPISEENIIAFRESIFLGEGPQLGHGGDTLSWYTSIFGTWFDGISVSFINLIERDDWEYWSRRFDYIRDFRHSSLRTFIEDFSLTQSQLFFTIENDFGLTMDEMDLRVESEIEIFGYRSDAHYLALRFSTRGINAIFSNNLYEIQYIFGGNGIVHNNMAFSPEWVFQNIEKAIYEKQLPTDEILRIISRSMWHPELFQLSSNAISVLTNANPEVSEIVLYPWGISVSEALYDMQNADIHIHDHYYNDNILIFVNLNLVHISYDEQQPVIIDDRTLVPLRAVMEHLGFTVDWEEAEQLVTLTLGDNIVHVQINNNHMQVDNNTVIIDVPPQLINERTMVPVRAIAEATGFIVDWDGNNRIVHITY